MISFGKWNLLTTYKCWAQDILEFFFFVIFAEIAENLWGKV